MKIDKENGNMLWMDAIRLEMNNVRIAFEEYDGDPNKLVGWCETWWELPAERELLLSWK
jgi:hypothetical protein